MTAELRGLSTGRLGTNRTLVLFVVAFAVTLAIGAGVIALVAPGGPPALCPPYRPCGSPPQGSPLVALQVFKSSQYGFTLEYPGSVLKPAQSLPAGVDLAASGSLGSINLAVSGIPASQGSPQAALTQAISSLSSNVQNLASDTSPADVVLGGGVGFRLGAGGAYTGDSSSPQGVVPETITAESATDGKVTITAVLVVQGSGATIKAQAFGLADFVINSIRWAS